ncbi:nitroreductase family protein [Streptomyces sp. NRRL B-24484]|uniref:nitroreductase family protein n=1 Tax=Streptomyces sp. NRRL B-24484 TaxID=1463833 RepID=UPI0006933D25|nr:nitroreductase family protein [Streptomyces sp. NRRL B-24484]
MNGGEGAGGDGEAVLRAIRTRRVVRALADTPVGPEQLRAVLDSARFAPHAGNRRLHRYVVVTRPGLLRALRMVSPGMLQRPAAAVVVCVDRDRVRAYGFPEHNPGPYIDVGTAAATMLLAAHGLGLGAGPVTSFSRAAVAELLGLPDGVRPELIVCLGHPSPQQPPPVHRRGGPAWDDLVRWERS